MSNFLKILMVVLVVGNMFVESINITDVYQRINKVFLNYEKKLTCCSEKRYFYLRLIDKIDKLYNNWKYCKYKKFLKIIKVIARNKLKSLNCANYNSSIYLGSGDRLLYNQFNYTGLVKDILSYSGLKLEKFFNSVEISGVDFLEDIKNGYIIKLKNKWYIYLGRKILVSNCKKSIYLNKCLVYLKSKFGYNRKFYGILKKNNGENIVYVFDSSKFVVSPFDFSLPISKSFVRLNRNGGVYIDKFLYTSKFLEKNSKLLGLVDINGKLYIVSSNGSVKYYVLDLSKPIYRFSIKDSYLFVVKQNSDVYFILTGGLHFYYLGRRGFYGDIDFNKFGKILFDTYYYIDKIGYRYTKLDFVKFLKFVKMFNQKKLSKVYRYITDKFEYDKAIFTWINKEYIDNAQLTKRLYNNIDLIKNWIIFYTIVSYRGVCESFSDILSLVGLLNGIDSDVVKGYIKRGKRTLLHQVSRIGNLYYDPTYDLSNKSLKYFGISKQVLLKYFTIKSDEKFF